MEIFGNKVTAVLDVWTVEHVLSGMSCGHLVRTHVPRDAILLLLLGAFAWECLEHYLETGLCGAAVAAWFHGVEFWLNRCVADPAAILCGFWIIRKCPALAWPARVLSLAWLAGHIVFMPHSMYLHELFTAHG